VLSWSDDRWLEVCRKSLPLKKDATVRGKSGLHRAECQLTAGECELMESTTENIPPQGKGEKVR